MSSHEWKEWCKSGEKPNDIPANPPRTYKQQWESWGHWLGTGRLADQYKVYRTFEDARKYVHGLKLKNIDQWKNWCKSGQKPDDIPARPDNTYKEQWKDWGDWLGTGYIAVTKRDYLPFEDARKYVHGLKLKNQDQWRDWCKSGQKPSNIPAYPSYFYKKKWKGLGDWLGTGYIATTKRHYLPFEDAKKYVMQLGFRTKEEYSNWCKSGQKPSDIPANPTAIYKGQWKGWGDWLGTGTIALQNKVYRLFEEAHKYVMKLRYRSREEYSNWCKSGQKPDDIPASPAGVYNGKWKGWGHWLGTGYIASSKRDYLPFEDARKYVHGLKLKTVEQWRGWCKSGQKPDDIPASPAGVYKEQWKGMGDWLGTGTIALQNKVYRSFEEAHKYVMKLRYRSREEYSNWCKSGQKPSDIPANPTAIYKGQWKGWGDWLGTGYIIPAKRTYRLFTEARAHIHALHLDNTDKWFEYCRSGNKPDDIPAYPYAVYEDEWIGWPDWLGYEERKWSLRKVKGLLTSS